MSDNSAMEWKISVPIFHHSVILRQLAIAVALPFGVVVAVMLFNAWEKRFSPDSLYGLVLIAALFLLTWLFIMVVYGGNYDAGFVIDATGIRCYTQKQQAGKNRIINWLAVLLGLLSRNLAAAGAGLLAQSRQSVFLKWSGIKKVNYMPKRHTIMVRGSVTESKAVFCTPENYAAVAALIQSRTIKNAGGNPAARDE